MTNFTDVAVVPASFHLYLSEQRQCTTGWQLESTCYAKTTLCWGTLLCQGGCTFSLQEDKVRSHEIKHDKGLLRHDEGMPLRLESGDFSLQPSHDIERNTKQISVLAQQRGGHLLTGTKINLRWSRTGGFMTQKLNNRSKLSARFATGSVIENKYTKCLREDLIPRKWGAFLSFTPNTTDVFKSSLWWRETMEGWTAAFDLRWSARKAIKIPENSRLRQQKGATPGASSWDKWRSACASGWTLHWTPDQWICESIDYPRSESVANEMVDTWLYPKNTNDSSSQGLMCDICSFNTPILVPDYRRAQ